MELENKLAVYRAKKKREERIEKLKQKIDSIFNWKKKSDIPTRIPTEQTEPLIEKEEAELPEISEPIQELETNVVKIQRTWTDWIIYTSALIFWSFSWSFFISQGFGTVFLIISALFGIYFNTRTGPKKVDEVSAYSVFNKNCESIDGTLKAEQFEREIRYGPYSIH